MFGALTFGQAVFAWMTTSSASSTPASTFVTYNAEPTAITTWQDTP